VPLAEIFVLALASMVWPALVAVVVVALASPQPVKLLSVFLIASLLTTVSIGLVIVFVLRGSSLFSGSRPTFSPVVDVVAGLAALVAGHVVRRGGRGEPHQSQEKQDRPTWTERTLTRGAPLAFLAGVVLNIAPGVFPFVALKNIAELEWSAAASVALVVAFYLVMFLPAEVPLGFYLVAPARTSTAVGRFNSWLKRNVHRVAALVLTVIGIYLVARGLVGLAAGGS
jgi:Sap-like sulfolipid-1-addressing protein